MLKKLFVLFIAFAPLAAVAQDGKMAYLNSQEIFNAMPELSDIEKQLSAKNEEIQKNGQALVEAFQTKLKEIQDCETAIAAASGEEKKKKETEKGILETELKSRQERIQSYSESGQKEMDELRMKLLQPVYQKIQNAIQNVGDEQKFAYIFDLSANSIVYKSTTAVDATPLVKAKLNLK
ncbi:MAG: OmpH family outer membrane protein [Dysgonamonadaceae bacterium]|jgi:outer membrane protein|nr:OmpH family outer membrane protein [Dysgonamonadaceae bacterium]